MRETTRSEKKNGFAIVIVLSVLVLIWPSLGRGDEAEEHKTAFRAGAGMIYHTGQNFEPGFVYYAGFFTLLAPRLGLEVLVAGNTVNMDEPPVGLTAGKLETTQVLISGQYRFAKDNRFTPYAIFGLEFNFYQFRPADEADEDKYNVVDRLAPHFGAGLDWALSDWLVLNADARYSIIKTWVEKLPREGPIGEVNPDEVDQINLNALTLTLGFKFYF